MTNQPSKTTWQRWRPLVWIFGGVAVLGVVASLGSGDDPGGGEYGARDVCEQFVSDRLVSPGSANFGPPETNELLGEDFAYRVTGSVDAENRMGATIRIDYECEVRHKSGDTWTLIDLQVNER